MTTKPIPPREAAQLLGGKFNIPDERYKDLLNRASEIYDRACDDLGEADTAPYVRDLLLDNLLDLDAKEVDELISRSYLGQRRREFTMYGCARQEIDDAVSQGESWGTDPLMVAASMLSDAQELMAMENATQEFRLERARQMINRVKYILFEKVRPLMKEEEE